MPAKIQTFESRPGVSNPVPSGVDSSQWSSNPYANFNYRHTWWQKLWEGLGFRSKFDEYRDSMALNANEYEAQLAEKAHNEQYDSALAQVERQRAAGINPDLAGSVDAGSSSGMEPDPNGPIDPGFNDPSSTLQQFGNMIMSGFTSAIGLSGQVVGLLGNIEDVQSKRNSNRSQVVEDAISWAMRHIPDIYPTEADVNKENDFFHNDGLLPDFAQDYALESGYRKRDAKLFSRTVRDFISSAPGTAEAYKAWYERGKARVEWAGMSGSSLFDESDSVLREILGPIISANDRIRKLTPQVQEKQLQAEGAQADYDSQYLGIVDPNLAGQVTNNQNERDLHSSNIDSILNDSVDEIISNLRDLSKSNKPGHGLATVAVLIFSILRMTNFHPSYSRQSSQGSTPWGPTSNTKTSIGF